MPRQLPVNGKSHLLNHRLSAVDAAFLYLERKKIPLHIASVGIFDGPIPFDEFVASIDSKLDQLPRYRQIAVAPPLNLGHPVWEDDPKFDIRRHIFRTRLEPPAAMSNSRIWRDASSRRSWTGASRCGISTSSRA